ncbi:hypothetical protein BMS3Bbin04_00743 [bacterium BMS3Bbin04]|nr:hypothetical protein BMS3Bbin04_00743 [bacterium BMS3Bbin04]
MNRIALLTLAALLILSVFGVANAQYANQQGVTLADGEKEVSIEDGVGVQATLHGEGGLGYLRGWATYDTDWQVLWLQMSDEGTSTATDTSTDPIVSIQIRALYPATWDNEYYKIQWQDKPID